MFVCVNIANSRPTFVNVHGNDGLLQSYSHVRIDRRTEYAHSLEVASYLKQKTIQNHPHCISTCQADRESAGCFVLCLAVLGAHNGLTSTSIRS